MSLLIIFILIVSELGLILAHTRYFSVSRLCVLTVACLAVALIQGRLRLRRFIRGSAGAAHPRSALPRGAVPPAAFRGKSAEILLLLLIAGTAGVLFFRPCEYVDGGWDPGTYINTGVHIARTGSLVYHDTMLTRLDKKDQEMLCARIRDDGTGIKYPGLYIKDVRQGLIVPQFFHLYPVWIAVFYKLAGLRGALYVNPFFALGSVMLAYFIGRRIGKGYGLLAALLLAVNVIQVWNARFSTSEVLGQFLFLGGVYLWARYLDSKDVFYAFWAGLALGEFLLVGVTSILIIPVVVIYLALRARRRDVYFIVPFVLILMHLAIQVRLFSSGYVESVIGAFNRTEMLLCSALFVVLLACLPLLKRIPRTYLGSFLALLVASALVYSYFVRPRMGGSIERLNLVELGRFLSLPGLILAAAGLVLLVFKEKREDILFLAITALVVAIFFIYDKRMYSRYPFALRRYVPIVIPAYCFSISYLCLFLTRYRAGTVFSVAVALLVIVVPFSACGEVTLVRDHRGSVDFWQRFARKLDDDAVYISSRYRWARPLADIFGKEVLVFSGVPEFGGEKMADFARRLINDGNRVYYVDDIREPCLLSVDLSMVHEQSMKTEYLEHHLTFPPVVRPQELSLRVFEVVPIEESGPLTAQEYTVHVGESSMGLISGFDKPRRFSGAAGYARWTLAEAELVIRWFGEDVPQTLTLFASGMPPEAGRTLVSLYVDDTAVREGYAVAGQLEEHQFFIPAGTVTTGGKKRAVLTIRSTTWDPARQGIRGYPDKLGVKLHWVRISRGDPS